MLKWKNTKETKHAITLDEHAGIIQEVGQHHLTISIILMLVPIVDEDVIM